jgi:hypothetical protein
MVKLSVRAALLKQGGPNLGIIDLPWHADGTQARVVGAAPRQESAA